MSVAGGMSSSRMQRQVMNSDLIKTPERLQQLAKLLDVDAAHLKLTKLFSTCTNGCNPTTFHALCDNKGPTLTFVQGPGDCFYGGYADISWSTTPKCPSDSKAFLFRHSTKTVQPEKFRSTGEAEEIYCRAKYGPTFGRYGHNFDFFTFDTSGAQGFLKDYTTHSKYVEYSGQNPAARILKYSGHQHYNQPAFDFRGPLIDIPCAKDDKHFQLEVLQVSEFDPAKGEFKDPWLPGISWTDKGAQSLWKQLTEFDPQQEGLLVNNINILLCGGVGAGKSSIICTLDSLCKGRKSDRASHGQGTGSLTRQLRKYSFKHPQSKQPLHWQVWDTMGWGVQDYKKGELEYILDGNLPDRCKLDQQITLKTPNYNHAPGLGDKVHCVCFVVPCSSASDESYIARLCEMRDVVRSRDVRMLILLTKIDAYDPDIIAEDLKRTFHSARLQVLMEDLLTSSGMGGLNGIHPIQNLNTGFTVSVEAGILLCTALRAALFGAVDYLEDNADSVDSEAPRDSYSPTEDEELAIANKNHNGRDGVLTLKKDQYYWVTPSTTQNGWLLGHDGNGNKGMILERMLTLVD